MIVVGIVLLLALVAFVYGFFEYYWLRVRTITNHDFQGTHQVPTALKGKRIVFVSDFQFDHKRRRFLHRAASQVVSAVNKCDPDLVILGGDLIHQKSSDNALIFDYIKEIKGEKLAVLGNHDYRDLTCVKAGLAAADVTLLINTTYEFKGMQIVGVDDYGRGNPQLPMTHSYTLLVSHNPDFFERVKPNTIDIALAGHMHAGQVTFFGKYAPVSNSDYKQRYVYGLVKRPQGTIYVSSGVGGSVDILPVRFFARPEIVVLNF